MSNIGPRGEKICSRKAISDGRIEGWMDVQADGQTDHFKAPAERGPNYSLIWNKVWLTYKVSFLSRLSKFCRPISTAMWRVFQHSCVRCVSNIFCILYVTNIEGLTAANGRIMVRNFSRYCEAFNSSVEKNKLKIHKKNQ